MHAMGVERDCSGQHDEKGDQLRKSHAQSGVNVDASQVLRGIFRRPEQRGAFALQFQFLDLLSCLPEK